MSEFFSIVVPIHNEAEFLVEGLEQLRGLLVSIGRNPDVCLVENGSTDATLRLADNLAREWDELTVRSIPEADYGAAMRDGLLHLPGEWVVTFDIDYHSGDFLERLADVRGEADVVIASKRAAGSADHRSVLRRTGTRVFNWLLRALLSTDVTDTHGIKAFSRPLIEELVPKVISRKDLFDTELVVRAERAGYRIFEVPVAVEEQRGTRSSYLRRVPGAVAGLFQVRSALLKERRNTKSR